jgi:hypothetical protein
VFDFTRYQIAQFAVSVPSSPASIQELQLWE